MLSIQHNPDQDKAEDEWMFTLIWDEVLTRPLNLNIPIDIGQEMVLLYLSCQNIQEVEYDSFIIFEPLKHNTVYKSTSKHWTNIKSYSTVLKHTVDHCRVTELLNVRCKNTVKLWSQNILS